MAKLCGCLVTSPPISSACPSGNCIYTPNLLIEGEDNSVTLCGETGIINIASKINTGLCTKKGYQYSVEIVKKTENITSISYASGQISFTLSESSLPYAEFKYKVKCGIYSSSGIVTIVPYNPCIGVVCDSGEVCNKCDGTCVEGPIITGEIGLGEVEVTVYNENNISY